MILFRYKRKTQTSFELITMANGGKPEKNRISKMYLLRKNNNDRKIIDDLPDCKLVKKKLLNIILKYLLGIVEYH